MSSEDFDSEERIHSMLLSINNILHTAVLILSFSIWRERLMSSDRRRRQLQSVKSALNFECKSFRRIWVVFSHARSKNDDGVLVIMPSAKLYDLCLRRLFLSTAHKEILLQRTTFLQLPVGCLRDLLIYLSPDELERLDTIYHQRQIPTNDLWQRHFELVWSLSRDDKDAFDSIVDVPYKRLYFEYLFHDTQILQLVIYTHVQQRNLCKSVCDLSFLEHMQCNLSRDSIIYSSKRRLADDQAHLLVHWNQQWNIYVKR